MVIMDVIFIVKRRQRCWLAALCADRSYGQNGGSSVDENGCDWMMLCWEMLS